MNSSLPIENAVPTIQFLPDPASRRAPWLGLRPQSFISVPLRRDVARQRGKQTCLSNAGIDEVMQSSEIAVRRCWRAS